MKPLLTDLRFFLLHILKITHKPRVQPLYDPFRVPVLTPLEARRARAKKILEENNLIRTQSRIQPQP